MPRVKCLGNTTLDKLSKDELVQEYKYLFDKSFSIMQERDTLRKDLYRRINHIRNMKGLPNV
jgi:hypothetical protein